MKIRQLVATSALSLLPVKVSCSFLGERNVHHAIQEMQKAKMNLRVDGMTGQWMLKSGDFFDFSRQVLPLIAYFCPKCNKLEFFVEKGNPKKGRKNLKTA